MQCIFDVFRQGNHTVMYGVYTRFWPTLCIVHLARIHQSPHTSWHQHIMMHTHAHTQTQAQNKDKHTRNARTGTHKRTHTQAQEVHTHGHRYTNTLDAQSLTNVSRFSVCIVELVRFNTYSYADCVCVCACV